MIRFIIYLIHITYIFITLFLPFYYKNLILLQAITILSWIMNNNKCLITQMEFYLFNETLIQFVYKKNTNFIVPRHQRYTLYLLFIINLFFLFYDNLLTILQIF